MLDIRRRTGVMFGLLMVGQIILVSAQVTTRSGPKLLSLVLFETFSRVQRGAAGVVHGTTDVWSNYAALRHVRDENEALRRQVSDLQVKLQEEHALAARSERLQQLLDLRNTAAVPTLAAEVIAGNPNPGMRTVTIDRGTADGVQADMAVIAPQGVVGRIVGPVATHAARVQLIVDRNAAAGAITERARAGGMVLGSDDDPPLKMDLVPNLSDVKPGDQVVSSGVDGIYPKGFMIGRIESVERKSGLYLSITVRPAVNFAGLEEVLVVMVPPRPAVPADHDEDAK
jgi:rod shape-determining protein MreC